MDAPNAKGLCMKRLALAFSISVGITTAVLAADLSVAPPSSVPVTPLYNWTGFYLGGNAGVAQEGGSFSDPLGNSLGLMSNGLFLVGGQIGVNYQFWGGVVIGVEADFDSLPKDNGTSGSTALLVNPSGIGTGSTGSIAVSSQWLTLITGRLGYAWDRLLLYGKGGGGWVGAGNPTFSVDGAPVSISTGNNNWAWTAGVGVEWAFWGNWSARLEYDYVGLNGQTFALATSAGGLPAGDSFTGNGRNIQLANFGINYKFGGW
jgi:outer membrane immunogenic protein